jgi:polyphosphate kinase
VTPVWAEPLKQRLWEVLDICLRDRRQAWVLESNGKYVQLHPDPGAIGPEAAGTHQTLMDLAFARANV